MMPVLLQTLPVEIIYRILNHLDDQQLFLSISNVCQSLNMIVNLAVFHKNHLSSYRLFPQDIYTTGSLFG